MVEKLSDYKEFSIIEVNGYKEYPLTLRQMGILSKHMLFSIGLERIALTPGNFRCRLVLPYLEQTNATVHYYLANEEYEITHWGEVSTFNLNDVIKAGLISQEEYYEWAFNARNSDENFKSLSKDLEKLVLFRFKTLKQLENEINSITKVNIIDMVEDYIGNKFSKLDSELFLELRYKDKIYTCVAFYIYDNGNNKVITEVTLETA